MQSFRPGKKFVTAFQKKDSLFKAKNAKYFAFGGYLLFTLLNAFGLYPVVEMPLWFHACVLALIFPWVYFIEKKSPELEEKTITRIYYITLLLFVSAANVTGGPASALKLGSYAVVVYALARGEYLHAAIMSATAFVCFARQFAEFGPDDFFAFPLIAAVAGALHLARRVKTVRQKEEQWPDFESSKDVRDFKVISFTLLENILKIYHSILKPVSIFFFIKDESDPGKFEMMMFSSSVEKSVNRDYKIDINEGVLGAALKKNDYCLLDVSGINMPYYRARIDIKKSVTKPVILNKVLGTLQLDYDRDIAEEEPFLKEMLEKLCVEIINILELFNISRKVVANERRITRMHDINEKLNVLEGRQKMMKVFFDEISSFDIFSGYLAEFSPDDGTFEVTESFNYPGAVKGAKFAVTDDEILKYVYNSGKNAVIEEVRTKNIRINLKMTVVDKFFIALLKNRDNIYGFIKLDKEKDFSFSDFEVKTLSLMVARIAMMLENLKLYEKIRKQATEDGLTGLTNHLTFQERLRDGLEKRDQGFMQWVSLILFDIDFFKKFNDSFGHQEGDRVLKKVADMLRFFQHKYENTFAARYGGEEFVFVLENYDIYRAAKIAEEVRAYSEENLKGGNEKEQRKITLSVGVTTYPDYARNQRELIKNADEALYMAKQEGRNRVKSVVEFRKR